MKIPLKTEGRMNLKKQNSDKEVVGLTSDLATDFLC